MPVKPNAKPLPPTPPPGDENIASAAAALPVGSAALPRLTDVLAALNLVNVQEIERITALLIQRYPDAELLLRMGRSFVDGHLTAQALEGIRATVWAEAVAAVATGKSVIVHNSVDLA